MQSKTSFFNITLFRKNLTRFWPLWGGASFVGVLFPLAFLLQMARSARTFDSLEVTEAYYTILCGAVPILSLIYAVLCAMMVWSYLYNARSVSLLHTLPITRKGLFATNFLSGMAMMLLPYAIVGTLCVLISVGFGAFAPMSLLMTILGVLGESFFYFATATFVAFVTGNIFTLPAVYFLLHFLAPLLDWLISSFAGNFIFGLSSGYTGAVEWLSPTVYLMRHLTVQSEYTERFVPNPSFTYGGYTTSELTSVTLENAWLVAVYALAGAVLLALAWLLYRRRRSECAGDVVAVGWMKPLFRFGIAALAALLGGQALYALFWSSFQDGRYYDALPMAVCMIVAGVIGYYAASMLLAKSLRVFKGSWKGLVLVAVGCVALCGVLRFDLLGISRRVPEAGQVEKVEFYAADNTYILYPGEDSELLEQVRALHRAIVEDQDYIRDAQNWGYVTSATDSGQTSAYTYLRLTYTLTNGLKVERYYSLLLTRARLAQEGTYDRSLNELINSEAMKAKRLHAGDARYKVEGGNLYLEPNGDHFDLSSREAAAVLEAVAKDAVSGAWGDYDWFDQNQSGAYAMNLELGFTYPRESGSGSSYDWISITVRPGMDNTVACLKDLGLVTDRDLVTREKLAQEDAVVTPEYPYDATANMGIIGGADGPAEVFVAGTVS